MGITRAKRRLAVTWSRRPSPFLAELGVSAVRAPAAGAARAERAPRNESPAADALRRWRLERARADEVPPYVIFPDRTIDELLARRPSSQAELAAIHGLGPRVSPASASELFGVLQQAVAAVAGTKRRIRRATREPATVRAPPVRVDADPDPVLYDALATWRRRRATAEAVPAYHVFCQPRSGRDRGGEAAFARRAPRCPRRRPGQARAVRRRGARPGGRWARLQLA